MKVNDFEDLICWKKARELCQVIIQLSRKQDFSKDFGLVNQIRNSSGSAMDNIAEGFNRGSNKEFIYFLFVSKGSVGETRSQLLRAFDQGFISEDELRESIELTMDIQRLLSALIRSVKQKPESGMKNWD